MSSLKTVSLSLAVVLASALTVQAAPHHRRPAHHAARHSAHAMHHTGMRAHGPAGARSMGSADNSADSLNAQSLSRAQAPQ